MTLPHSVPLVKSLTAGLCFYTPSNVCPDTVGMNNLFTCDVWHVLVLGTAVNEEQMRLVPYFAVLCKVF